MSKKLEGLWLQTTAIENGEAIDKNDEITLAIEDTFFVVLRNGKPDIEGVFEVNALEPPTAIDWKDLVGADSGKVFESVCVVGDEHFEFCAADEGLARPKSFEATTGHTIRRFERIRTPNPR